MRIFLIVVILRFSYAAKPPVLSTKSKLCGNEQCDEVLFKAKVKRVMGSNHEAFLSLTQDEIIDVTAVKFSDRTDLMEGMLKDGRRGNFYISAIDIGPYVEFLRNAITLKKEMIEISQDRADIGPKKFIGSVRADLHLVRDYNVQASRYAEEQNIVHPELLPLSDSATQSLGGHESGHGNSHGNLHGSVYGGDISNLNEAGHSHEKFRSAHSGEAGYPHDEAFSAESHQSATNSHIRSHGEQVVIHSVEKLPSSDVENLTNSDAESAKVNSSEMDNDVLKLVVRDEALLQSSATEQKQHVEKIPASPVEENLFKSNVDGKLLASSRISTGDIIGSSHSASEKSIHAAAETAISPPEPLRQQVQANVGEGQTTPQPVVTTNLSDQQTNATHKNEEEAISVQDPNLHLEQQTLESASENPVTVIPTQYAVDRNSLSSNSLSSQATTVSPPAGHDFHVTGSSVATNLDASYHEATTLAEDNYRFDTNVQGSLHTAEKLSDVISSGVNSPMNEGVSPSATSSSLQYCTREDCTDKRSSVSNPRVESAHMAEHKTLPPFFDKSLPSNDVQEAELKNSHSGFVCRILRSLAGMIRSVPFLDDVDDAGIAFITNISLLMSAVVFHIISSFLSDFDDSIISDRMVTHDLATKCKFLDEQNKVKDIEINRLGSVAGRFQGDFDEAAELRKELCVKELEIQNLVRRSECLKCDLDEERKLRVSLEGDVASERKRTLLAEEKATESRRLLDDSERAHLHTVNELASTRKALERLEKDLQEERQIHEETVINFKKAKDVAVKLQVELQIASEEIKKLELEKNSVELENATLSCMIEEVERNRKEGSAGESGGSGGWSDFGDDITGEADNEKERTPASSTVTIPVNSLTNASDVREAAKLRVQMKKTEQEFVSIKLCLDNEKEERRRLELKLVALENELERKKREVEERERDRSRADERCNELLAIMKDNNAKARETELVRDKLRDEITALQHELSSTVEDKNKKEEKIVELESDLKRMRNEHLKLETKRFNEVMELKRRLDVLQANQSLSSAGQTYDLNQSASSLERDARSPISLWEEAPRSSRNRTTSPENNLLFGSFSNSKKGTVRIRKSDLQRNHSPSEGEKRKERKESSHRRIRSRSNGRQLWNDRVADPSSCYMPVENTFPTVPYAEFDTEMLNRRHNRSSFVYYSSGGSNGGRSPPPEMPLLSAVPPPGVKKPAGKRAIGPGLEFKSS